MTKKKRSAKKVTEKERWFYVGPNVVVNYYPLWKNTAYLGLPSKVLDECNKNIHLKRMFVKSDEVVQAFVDLKNENSSMSISYRKIEKGYK